jgi:AraC-like DNA-binding protein
MALLYLGIGRSVTIAPEVEHTLHQHSTLQVTLALDHAFSFRTHSSRWKRTRCVAVNSGVPHQARDLVGHCVTVHVVPERWRTAHLTHGFLDGDDVRFLDGMDLSKFAVFFRGLLDRESGCSPVFQQAERLIEELTGLKSWTGAVDNRLLDVLERIQAGLPGSLRSRDLARGACLSEDRFLHLFKEQLGITLRHYIIHQRLLRATADILAGSSVTRAAIDAGFVDSAHFSRRFFALAGFPPSRLKQARGAVRIYSCHSSRCVRPASSGRGDSACGDCVLFREQQRTSFSALVRA